MDNFEIQAKTLAEAQDEINACVKTINTLEHFYSLGGSIPNDFHYRLENFKRKRERLIGKIFEYQAKEFIQTSLKENK